MNLNKAVIVLSLLAWFGGCLPGYFGTIRPIASDKSGQEEDGVSYRMLTLEDFRSSASSDNVSHSKKTTVVSCTRIRTASKAKVVAIPKPLLRRGEYPGYIGNITDLEFYTVLDRECLAWNQRNAGWEVSILLEHEQAHFAIMEIAARRLNRQLYEGSLKFRFKGATQDEVGRAGEKFIANILRKGTEQALARSQQFDLETDHGSLVEKQDSWVELLQEEMEDLVDYIGGP